MLPGGLRVVTEAMPGVRSASIGVWVGVGSRDESPALAGASHFLEHLLFKGTPTRSALDISVELDEVGGEFNAFTAKEYTCFHARVLDEDLPLAVDVLGDMITSSTITAEDVEAEREVILDEIAMHDDDPDDVVHNVFAEQAWGDLAAGPPDRRHRRVDQGADPARRSGATTGRRYTPENMVVAVAGNVDHATVVRLVTQAFARAASSTSTPRCGRRGAPRRAGPAVRRPATSSSSRPFEQANLVLGVNGLVRTDERRYALGVLNAALGGGTSSRLFQEVREHRGLAYSVYSYAAHYADAGSFAVAVGCLPSKVTEVLAWSAASSAAGRGRHLAGRAAARQGPAARRPGAVAWRTPAPGCPGSPRPSCSTTSCPASTRCCSRVDEVTLEDVNALARELFTQPQTLAVVGPFDTLPG